jgi:membrane-associated phospholipid phosphatase
MKEKYLIISAKVFSMLFAPFYFPVLAFLVLFIFSYMKLLPLNYKLVVLGIVYLFTVAFPLLAISGYKRINSRYKHQMTKRELRSVPYIICICCYGCCLYLMQSLHIPHFMISVLVGAFVIQVLCAIINTWIRISTHSAAAGAMNGALLAFSIIFSFDPTWWLCLTLLITGLVGSSRLVLRQHSLHEVNYGILLGFLCGFFCILYT